MTQALMSSCMRHLGLAIVLLAGATLMAGCTRYQQATLVEPDFVADQGARSPMAAGDGDTTRQFFDPVDRRSPGPMANAGEDR